MVRIFRALSDPTRVEIVQLVSKSPRNVTELTSLVGVSQPKVSRHLKILKDCGLLKYRKDGNRRLYSVADPRIFEIIDAVDPDLVDALTKRIIEQIA